MPSSKTFEIEVIETRAQRCCYTIKAKSKKEARQKAEIGDTVEEHDVDGKYEVVERTIIDP